MKNALPSPFEGLRTAWQDGWAAEVKRSAIAFVFLILLSFGACMLLPDLREALVGFVISHFSALDGLDETEGMFALALFSNNVGAVTFTMIYGLIPFIHLPALSLGLNAMLLGILAAHYAANGLSLAVFFALLLPHGVFEFPALILSFSMGLYVCGQLTRRCRREEGALDLWSCLVLISRLLLLALIPLLLLAAVTEAYVTPLIASLFL